MREDDTRRHRARAALARALLSSAVAVAAPLAAQDEERVGIPVGEAEAYPELRIDYRASDNVFLETDDPLDGSSVVVSPSVELVADRRLLTLRATYVGEFAQGSEDVLDYADHTLQLTTDAEFDKRNRVSGSVTYLRDHQEFGVGLTRVLAGRLRLSEPIVFDQFTVTGNYRYGVVDARGNLEAGVSVDARSYANLDAITDGRDVTTVRPYGLFSYRLSSDARALVELRYGAISVDNGVDDRNELSLFGGAEFAATGRLRGAARVGVTRADYDVETREDATILAARVDVSYRLREYATLQLRADREFDDGAVQVTNGVAAQAVTDTLRLSWLQEWSSRLSHVAYAQRSSLTQECPSGDSSTLTGSVELNYSIRRWLSFGAGALIEGRSGEDCAGDDEIDALDYDRRVLEVHVRATL